MARRKAAVVAAVFYGQITLEEACRRYELTEEEFLSWQRAFETNGVDGLRTTYLQQHRRGRSSPVAETASVVTTEMQQEADPGYEGLQEALAPNFSMPKRI